MLNVVHYVSIMNRGGEETLIMNIFRNIDRNKFKFSFLCTERAKGAYDDEILSLGGIINYIQLDRLNSKLKQIDNKNILKDYLKIHKDEIDVFHIHTQHAMVAYFSALAAQQAGIKKIIVHSHNNNTLYHRKAHFIFRPLLNSLHITRLACSIEAGKWLFGNKKVTVVYNAIDPKKFEFDKNKREEIRSNLNVEDNIVIGHVGRFNEQKNHKYIIDIFEKLVHMDDNYRLMLIGTGELENEIKEISKEKGIYDKILFMGVSDRVNELYNAMDLFLFPSKFEGLPVVLIETQTNGLNCVISSTINKEIGLTKSIHWLSLSNNSEYWAKYINDNIDELRLRNNNDEIIEKSLYNMKNQIKIIERIYSSGEEN